MIDEKAEVSVCPECGTTVQPLVIACCPWQLNLIFALLGAISGIGLYVGFVLIRGYFSWGTLWGSEPEYFWIVGIVALILLASLMWFFRSVEQVSQRLLYTLLALFVLLTAVLFILMIYNPFS